jgi:uncharacterized RDD family membrane protein YckC
MSLAAHRPWRRHAADVGAPAAAAASLPHAAYVGLVTRVIAFSIDAAIINVVAITVTAAVTLIASVLSLPDSAQKLAIAAGGGTLYLVWAAGYFVVFWTTTGQTPGNRLMRIRVQATTGDTLLPRRALLRFAALALAALPMFAGLLLILVDDRRRGLHDWLARSVVVEAPTGDPPTAARRERPAQA